MLQTIRENSQGIIAKGIIGLIIITFALWGIESLVSLTNREPAPAEVNGEDISKVELAQGIDLQRRQILNQMQNQNIDPSALDDGTLHKMVLDKLIREKVLTQSAEDRGMAISKQMIDQIIVQTPQFQVDGKFNRDMFEGALRNAGMTPLMFREMLKKEQLMRQDQAGFVLSAFALPSEVDHLIELDSQTRDFAFTTLNVDPKSLDVKQDEIQAYYDKNQSRFMTPEQVTLDYIELDKEALAAKAEVTDADIKQAYDQLVASFKSEEERDASHILIDVTKDRDEAQAKAEAESVRQKIEAGELSFADAAKQYSSDLGSASNAGELGFNARGVFVGPFEDALFGLKKGEISKPVKTEFGYHLIKLNAIRDSKAPTLASVRGKLETQVADQKAEQQYVAELEKLSDLTFSSSDLASASDELGLEIKKTQSFGHDGGKGEVSSNAKVIEAAFSDQILKDQLNSDPIELSDSKTVVVHLKDHQEPRQLALDEVKDQIVATLQAQKAQEIAQARSKEWLDALQQGKSLADLDAGAKWTELKAANRGEANAPAPVVIKAFSMAKPAEGKVTYALADLGQGQQAIVALKGVTNGKVELTDEQRKSATMMLSGQRGQEAYAQRVQALRDAAKVEINN